MVNRQYLTKHLLILSIFLILLLPSVYSQVTAEISTDNVTFIPFTTIDQGNRTACASFLDADTNHFVRAKNTTTSFTTIEQRTLPGGLNQIMIATILGLSLIILFFSFLAVKIKGVVSKIFLVAFSLIELVMVLFILSEGGITTAVTDMLTLNFKLLFFIIFGIIIAGLFLSIIRLGNIATDKKEDKQAEEEGLWNE